MTTVAYPGATGQVGVTDAATFIPEVWSNEIRASYEANLVLANLVKKLSMVGKKGDTINIPAPIRGTAVAKAENTAVSIQANTELNVAVVINSHYEYSRLIEDIVKIQGLSSLRKFYTEDAGYALAAQVDDDLFTLGTGLGDGTYDATPDATGADWVNTACFYADAALTPDGLVAYAADTVVDTDVLADVTFRALVQKMDDADVPMSNRSFIVPPSLCNTLRGIDRYVSSDFTNDGKIPGGRIGNLYGVEVHVSTQCPVLETVAENGGAATVDIRGAFLVHRDTFILAESLKVRSQKQYKQEYLADLYTADTIYGVKTFRPDAGFILAVPDVAG